jgi:hypothetical protein
VPKVPRCKSHDINGKRHGIFGIFGIFGTFGTSGNPLGGGPFVGSGEKSQSGNGRILF